jgi:hypothetical protein
MRRESHESHNHYMQKLSLTSVLTPSFAKNNQGVDTPSGKSDFSFAIKDMFSERSSGGSSQNFSEGRKKTLSKMYSSKKGNSLRMNRQFNKTTHIYRFDSHERKSRQMDPGSLN